LNLKGTVDFVLGDKPDTAVLGDIGVLSVTSKGWIYASDERTGAVHVFNERGARQHVNNPLPGDYAGQLRSPSMTVADSGDVFITHTEVGMGTRPDFLHYDSEGKRVGIEKVSLDEVAQAWIAQPGTRRKWVLGYTRAYLADESGKIVRKIDRTADGQWVETPGPGAVSPDGSIAIVSGARGDPLSRSPPKVLVSIFSKDGEPITTWPAPSGISTSEGALAFDGEKLAFVERPAGQEHAIGVLVTDKRGSVLSKSALAALQFNTAVFFVQGQDATELWLYDGKKTIDRYALP
jgi:hypothetical protein